MATDFLDASTYTSAASGVIQISQTIIMFLLILFMVAGISWFVFQALKYKHTVIIRTLINNRVIITAKKAMQFTDKKGVKW